MVMRIASQSSGRRLLTASLAVALIVSAVFLRTNVLEPMRVYSVSMEPSLEEGDWILVRRTRWAPAGSSDAAERPFARGDVVVFRTSAVVMAVSQDDTLAVKRIAAVPGDTVQTRDGAVFVNGLRYHRLDAGAADPAIVDSSQLASSLASDDSWKPEWARVRAQTVAPMVVPVGQVYLIGDNLPSSVDSRRFGTVSISAIKGRVVLTHFRRRWLPW